MYEYDEIAQDTPSTW